MEENTDIFIFFDKQFQIYIYNCINSQKLWPFYKALKPAISLWTQFYRNCFLSEMVLEFTPTFK